MKFLTSIEQFMSDLPERSFKLFIGISLALVIFLAAAIITWQWYSVSSAQEQLEAINSERERIGKIVSLQKQTQREQKEIDQIIDQEPFFNLKEYFLEVVLAPYRITPSKEIDIRTINRNNPKYEEREIKAELREIDMEMLTRILQTLDQNKRITVKDLDITQGQANTINVIISIATLVKKI